MSNFENNDQMITDLGKLDTTPLTLPPEIKIEYMSVTGKQSALVNRALEGNISLQTGKISINFSEPMWVYDLTLWIDNGEQSKSEKLNRHVTATIHYARGGKKEITLSAHSTYLDCYPRDFLVEIELKFYNINKTLLSSPPVCNKINLSGFTAAEYAEFAENAGRYIHASNRLNEAKEKLLTELNGINIKITDAETAFEVANANAAEAKVELAAEQEKLNNTKLKLSQTEAKIGILNSQAADLEQRINENEQSNRNLSKSIQDNREELQTLLANKNVFMEEFGSYVEQGRGNIQSYVIIGLILLAIVGVCLSRLIASALALSNDPSLLTTVSAFDLFLSRLPIAFVLGAVMIICIRMISILLGKIFEIHQERLLLSKLSILAKDNSFFSAAGIDVPSDLIYDKRVALKMELLKEFLSGNYRGALDKEKSIKEEFDKFKETFRKKQADEQPKANKEASEDYEAE